MKIGTIGTSAITSQWIQTAQEIQDVSIEIIYSRNIEKAQKFAKEHHVMHFTDSLKNFSQVNLSIRCTLQVPIHCILVKQKKPWKKAKMSF